MIKAKAANLIITKGKKVLLCKRAKKEYKNYWSIPGGTVKKEESFESAMIREIKEEIDCRVKNYKFFNKYFLQLKENLLVEAHYFVGEIDGKIKLNAELSEAEWFDLEVQTINTLNIAFNQKSVLFDFINSLIR